MQLPDWVTWVHVGLWVFSGCMIGAAITMQICSRQLRRLKLLETTTLRYLVLATIEADSNFCRLCTNCEKGGEK